MRRYSRSIMIMLRTARAPLIPHPLVWPPAYPGSLNFNTLAADVSSPIRLTNCWATHAVSRSRTNLPTAEALKSASIQPVSIRHRAWVARSTTTYSMILRQRPTYIGPTPVLLYRTILLSRYMKNSASPTLGTLTRRVLNLVNIGMSLGTREL